MPYKTVGSLPASVREHLPRHAQEIYLAAYNNAWKQYRNAEDRHASVSREELAHKVAWAAVKQKFEKHDGKWQRKR